MDTIATVEAIPVSYPEPNDFNALPHLCLVKITTKDGVVGWGESITQFPEANFAVKAIIEGMAERVVGKDPFDVEAIWEDLYNRIKDYGTTGMAISASRRPGVWPWLWWKRMPAGRAGQVSPSTRTSRQLAVRSGPSSGMKLARSRGCGACDRRQASAPSGHSPWISTG